MALVDQLRPANNLSDLEKYTIHAVRNTLKAMNVYHACWDIVIEQRKQNQLVVTAWIPERITMPNSMSKPVVPIHFTHLAKPMSDFLDVDFWPIARELGKQMTLAMKLGPAYGRA